MHRLMGHAIPAGPAIELRVPTDLVAKAGEKPGAVFESSNNIANEVASTARAVDLCYRWNTWAEVTVRNCFLKIAEGAAVKSTAPKPEISKLVIVQVGEARHHILASSSIGDPIARSRAQQL